MSLENVKESCKIRPHSRSRLSPRRQSSSHMRSAPVSAGLPFLEGKRVIGDNPTPLQRAFHHGLCPTHERGEQDHTRVLYRLTLSTFVAATIARTCSEAKTVYVRPAFAWVWAATYSSPSLPFASRSAAFSQAPSFSFCLRVPFSSSPSQALSSFSTLAVTVKGCVAG